MDEPKSISLTGTMDITAGADAGEGKAALPRFSMVAYTGGRSDDPVRPKEAKCFLTSIRIGRYITHRGNK